MYVPMCLQAYSVPVCRCTCMSVHALYVCLWRLEVNLSFHGGRVSHLLWSLLIQPGRLRQQVSGILLAHLPSSGITGRVWLFPVHSEG